ncbi:MAG: hypothetical protein P8Q99_14360 [Paracoccaceae bacterium]|nr:hypothetical protein RB2150_03643 [Rhodobacterales bacterium HTCC2150] [Rhodobacteraceae bacterium HTCC2150]MDG1532520.1 hypothetical protein [Paracoccaceae bacterium]
MSTLIAALIGIAWGIYLARSRGGDWKDAAQYAAGFGICFALVAIVISVILLR